MSADDGQIMPGPGHISPCGNEQVHNKHRHPDPDSYDVCDGVDEDYAHYLSTGKFPYAERAVREENEKVRLLKIKWEDVTTAHDALLREVEQQRTLLQAAADFVENSASLINDDFDQFMEERKNLLAALGQGTGTDQQNQLFHESRTKPPRLRSR